jgi:hypothetical protein
MTQAIAARRDGDAFQARIFWLKAAKLLDGDSNVQRVGFESGAKGFDDVWVEYDAAHAPKDASGNPFHLERFQCKWHARPGQFTHVDLTNPVFINAETSSFLQRAHGAHQLDRAKEVASGLRLITNYGIDPNDALHGLINTRSSSLRMDEFFQGKTAKSKNGALRDLWSRHLGIDEAQLRTLCASLGFFYARDSLEGLREQLDDACLRYGLARIDPGLSATVYDDIPFKWAAQRRLEFDRKSFRDACDSEKLLAAPKPRTISFGIKSFEHAFDRLEERCADVLNLIPEFDDRYIRDTAAWRATLQPAIQAFLKQAAVQSSERIRLAMDTHATLAFAAGAVLNTKSGRITEIEQRSPTVAVWAPDDATEAPNWSQWQFESHVLDSRAEGVAVAVCVTHDVVPQVRAYMASAGIRELLIARLSGGAGQQSIACGAHANALAERLAAHMKSMRPSAGSEVRSHLFIAAPNAFTFYLGRQIHSLTPLTLYEFDFDGQRNRSYVPSLSYPEADSIQVSTA